MTVFTQQHTVLKEEIDLLHHVNNVVYLKWTQDIATQHWNALTKENPQENYVWVVIRHEIDYIKSAVLGDVITLKTWVGAHTTFKSIRHVEIFKEGVLLAKAQTTWCMLDAKTYKPLAITENVLNLLKP